ncbi:hypothetical protein K491DRAFT_685711 [Lophiostoma macrostomum CBS 122681]|uniref:Uncharacterized protein n=1 Tax=Lophiostoma macrostomum CBS 122681 TaxID=1314788 RepID=A0A6A6SIK4_9PLEO|nr:hypothetical protein K491DRAFT_685711 [Lophiostoma macrostomum CBS 122681]
MAFTCRLGQHAFVKFPWNWEFGRASIRICGICRRGLEIDSNVTAIAITKTTEGRHADVIARSMLFPLCGSCCGQRLWSGWVMSSIEGGMRRRKRLMLSYRYQYCCEVEDIVRVSPTHKLATISPCCYKRLLLAKRRVLNDSRRSYSVPCQFRAGLPRGRLTNGIVGKRDVEEGQICIQIRWKLVPRASRAPLRTPVNSPFFAAEKTVKVRTSLFHDVQSSSSAVSGSAMRRVVSRRACRLHRLPASSQAPKTRNRRTSQRRPESRSSHSNPTSPTARQPTPLSHHAIETTTCTHQQPPRTHTMPPSQTPTPTPNRRTSLIPKTPPSDRGYKLEVVKTIMPHRTASDWSRRRPLQIVRRVSIEPRSSPAITVESESVNGVVTASPSPSLVTEAGHRIAGADSPTPSRCFSVTLPVRAKGTGGSAGASDAAAATGYGSGSSASLTLPERKAIRKEEVDMDGDVRMEGEEHGEKSSENEEKGGK